MTRQPPTPWAENRVPGPHMPAPTECHYCTGEVELAHHEDVYGRTYSNWPWLYRCTECGAMVGTHPGTLIPLGTLANASLRKLRRLNKETFERLRYIRFPKRTLAYQWLADVMGMSPDACHWGLFNEEQCLRAGEICEAEIEKLRTARKR